MLMSSPISYGECKYYIYKKMAFPPYRLEDKKSFHILNEKNIDVSKQIFKDLVNRPICREYIIESIIIFACIVFGFLSPRFVFFLCMTFLAGVFIETMSILYKNWGVSKESILSNNKYSDKPHLIIRHFYEKYY